MHDGYFFFKNNMKNQRGNFTQKKKRYQTVKYCLTRILLNSQIVNPFIQDRCVAVAVKASHL